MATVPLIQYEDALPKCRPYSTISGARRNVEDVNNFWKALANHPETLKRTWDLVRDVMKPGALDELNEEMIYAAVSIANNCEYCIHSHTAAAFNKGMTPAQYEELLAVVAAAHNTNALANGFKIPVDPQYNRQA